MASNVRRCDLCQEIFETEWMRNYKTSVLPRLDKIKYLIDELAAQAKYTTVQIYHYDVCPSCILEICKTIEKLHKK